MRSKTMTMLAGLVLAVAGTMGSAQAVEHVYTTAPGGPFIGYSQPFVVIAPGDTIRYVNLDPFPHDVIALHPGPDTQWCLDAGRKDKYISKGFAGCPLFWTPLIGLSEETPVLGLDNVVPGASYGFFCSIHANMEGTLIVLPV